MLDEKNGWAITTENELVYMQKGLSGFYVVKHFEGISKITGGYLLYCSTPAAGQMVKLLFATTDGGENFSFVQDVTNDIEGYPQGISFLNAQYGYIAMSYHGQDAYLYETTDGGNIWSKETPLPKEDNINYIDGFAPVFFGEKQWNGIMLAKEVSDKAYYKVLTTVDGGAIWKIEGIIEAESIHSY